MLSRLRQLSSRPGARAAARNLGWLVAEKGARLVLNVGVGFWVARYLGPAQFGALNFSIAVVGIVALLAELGLEAVVRRELVRAPEDGGRVLATTAGLRLAGGAVAAGLLATGVLLSGAAGTDRALLLVTGLTLFQPALTVADLWFQARLQAKFSVLAQLGALTAGAAVRVALIAAHGPLVGFAWALVVEMAVAGVLFAGLARRAGRTELGGGFDGTVARRLMREAWPLMLSGFAVMLYMRIDAVMLRRLVGETEVGIYAAATRFTEIWYFVPVALASSLLPALLRARERGPADYVARLQASYDLNAGIAYVLAAPLALTAPWLVRVAYGAEYVAAGPVLALHAWSSVFVFLGVARSQYLVNEGHTRFYLGSTVAGLAVNVALNFWLIPRDGAWGAALATVVAQAVAAWLSTFGCAPLRSTAWMQTKALLIPFTWYRYVRRS